MKKVLIVSYFWPYCAGSKRVFGLAKYLPSFGWEPIVLTGPLERRPDPSFRFIETGYRGLFGSLASIAGLNANKDLGNQIQSRLQKSPLRHSAILRFLYNAAKELLAYPDEHKGWKPFALRAARELIAKERVDAAISIWPFTGHLVACELAKEYKIPWIADFPDLWSDNAAYSYSSARRFFDRRLERNILASADVLTTSSEFYRQKLQLPRPGKRVRSIPMGFDPALLNVPAAPLTKQCTITYTGMLYGGKRTPTKFFRALSELIAEKAVDPAHIEIRFYGPTLPEAEHEVESFGLSAVVRQYPSVPFEECVAKQRESQILLQLNWDDPADKGVFSGKMLDYLAARRPILAVGGSKGDIVGEWIAETNAGVRCLNAEETKRALLDFYREWEHHGFVAYRGNTEAVNGHSGAEMAKRFADVLSLLSSPS